MTQVVVDSGNMEHLLSHAGLEPEKKEAPKETPKPDGESSPDEIEGEDGLTPAQKREMSNSMIKAIAKKHRAQKEAEDIATQQYNDRVLAERRAEELERELQELRAKAEPKKESKRPERKDFSGDDEAWVDATIKWGVAEGLREQAARDAEAAAQRQQAEIAQRASEQLARAAELVPDFADVISSADIELSKVTLAAIQKSSLMAEISYHLATHPDELKSISKLDIAEQLVAIGEIRARVKPFGSKGNSAARTNGAGPSEEENVEPPKAATNRNGGQAKPVEPSTARTAPVFTPLRETGARVEKDPADMSYAEIKARYQAQHKVDFGRRKRH